jgi:hypothetical protein
MCRRSLRGNREFSRSTVRHPTAAEPVERTAGAKGNANQQGKDRAQNRATVSQALERIRKVAKERKKERIWLRTLRRRSQKDRSSWQQMHSLAADWIPQPRILHPYPDKRFAATHARWEPCAGIPPARIWAGGG